MSSSTSSSSAAYSHRPGGSLKFKGSSANGAKDKKKKKKSKSSTSADAKKASGSGDPSRKLSDEDRLEADLLAQIEDKEAELAASGRKQTESEKKFEEMRRKRMHQRIQKEAKLSHKEKVDAFNQYLASLSEHHDIPKVGPG
ncbi:uncharacterized protein PFL1_06065 [Pseudozyma flocculosa PF-1]|uniref:DUF1754-domain-containing protein n=2 Tax=Pseudozyma flocculosa TaxID=84751 RepID=A0A5C3F6C8_9BASI|nr:uncharacterized protein PFL1_06065 [Pseudozyma flocculosa PF-1]EPQ26417.1 hypothetical protein PFL1_06065 [Pseudozyma flocculosa PF-1]SPO38989.1 uncharacterized protein PSFLO_04468 [Pseudozyma flocculosa]